MFRVSLSDNDPVYRNDPFFSSSFPRPFSSPFSSLFDFPPVSAPVYYLTEDEEPEQWVEKYEEPCSKSSSEVTTTGKKGRKGKRRTIPRSLISPLVNTALTPFNSRIPTMDMKVDMFSTPNTYSVHATVPGVKKEDISTTVQNGVLTIEAERREVDTSEHVNYHHVESFYGRVTRSIQLPGDARLDELIAKYEDGVLKIEVPRANDEKNQQRKILIQ